jgi:hypothetical protein
MIHGAFVSAVLALGVLLGTVQEAKSIKDVMAAAHKGKEAVVNKIRDGKGTDDEIKKVLALYEVMVKFKAPKGDEKSWTDKSGALLAAAKELSEKKAGALEKFKAASDCKGCHSLHKP